MTVVAVPGVSDRIVGDRTTLERMAALALWITVATIPWAGVVTIGGDTLAKAVALAGAPFAVAALTVERMRRPVLGTHVLAFAFAGWAAASLWWSIDTDVTFTRGLSALQFAALLAVTWQCGPLGRRVHLAHAYVVGSCVTCFVIVSAWTAGKEIERYTAAGSNPNDVAFILLLAIPMAWYASVTTTSVMHCLLLRAFVPVAIFCALLTASRSALVLLPVALLIVPLMLSRLPMTARGLVLVLAVVVAVVVPSMLPGGIIDRLSTTDAEITSGTFNERERLWEGAQRTIEDAPILGVGAGASRDRIVDYLPRGARPQGAHNAFLSVGAELGVVGLILFSLLLLSVFNDGLRAGPDAARLTIVLAALLVIGLQVRHWEYQKALWAVLAVIVELQLVAPLVQRTPRAQPIDHPTDTLSAWTQS
jgi:O-antigen ligase